MPKSQIDSAALLLAVLGAAVALMLMQGPFAWLASIAGLILLFVLFSYDREGYRSISQSLAFSAVCGFCVALAAGILFQLLAAHGEVHLADGGWSGKWMPLTCAFATVVIWAIDRVRMANREPVELRQARLGAGKPQGFIPRTTSAPASARSAPVMEERVVAQTPEAQTVKPAPASVSPQTQAPPSAPEPILVRPAAVEPTPASFAPQPVAPPSAPEPILVRPAPAEPARPSPAPIIPRTGRETMIYVTLVGEGMNLLRSVTAEHVGRDFYRIVEEMPEGEIWEYRTGQVVRCKKKNLSSGKALVATEEAPRANP